MPRRAVTPEQHALLLAAFREQPGDVGRAAAAAAVDPRTGRRAWLRGWPGRPAIRDQLAEEAMLARAALRKESLRAERETAPLDAAADAAASAAAEVRMARLAGQVAVDLLDFARRQVDRLAEVELKPVEVLAAARVALGIAEAAQRIEHVRLGTPSQVI